MNQQMLTFIEVPSNGKHNKILYDGHYLTYDRTNTNSGKKYYRCTRSYCKFRLHTLGTQVVHVGNSHNHLADPIYNYRTEVIQNIKTNASLVPSASPKGLVSSVLSGVPLCVKASLPKVKSLTRLISRKRKIDHLHWPIANRVQDIIVPDIMKRYVGNNVQENFMLADSGNVPDRIFIFGREGLLDIIRHSDCVYIDGTFKLAPPMFAQVVVIIGKKMDLAVPVMYCLLQNKAQSTYVNMFQLIKSLLPNYQPPAVSCDYELALINAVKSEFPSCTIRGCLFHLSQNILRKIQRTGMQQRFLSDLDFKKHATMIIGLAFLPVDKVAEGVTALIGEVLDDLVPVVEWFKENYIERHSGASRRQPTFPTEIWNQYERVLSRSDRTNNYAEAAHRALYSVLSGSHPNLWSFIDMLKTTQNSRDVSIEHVISGFKAPTKKAKYKEADERIYNLVSSFNANSNVLEFLKGISNNWNFD